MGFALELALDDPTEIESFVCSICREVSPLLCSPVTFTQHDALLSSRAAALLSPALTLLHSSTASQLILDAQMTMSSVPGAPVELETNGARWC